MSSRSDTCFFYGTVMALASGSSLGMLKHDTAIFVSIFTGMVAMGSFIASAGYVIAEAIEKAAKG